MAKSVLSLLGPSPPRSDATFISLCVSGGWQCRGLPSGSVWALLFHPLIKSCTFLIGEQNLQKRKKNPPFQNIQGLKFIWLWNAHQGLTALLRGKCWKPVTHEYGIAQRELRLPKRRVSSIGKVGSNSRTAPQGAFRCRDWAGHLGMSTLLQGPQATRTRVPWGVINAGDSGQPSHCHSPLHRHEPSTKRTEKADLNKGLHVLHLYLFSFTRNSGQEAFQITEQLFQHQTSFKCEIITDSEEVAKIVQRGLFPQFPQRWLLTSLWYHRKIRKLTLGPPGALGFTSFAYAHSGGAWRVRAVLPHVDSRDQHHHHDAKLFHHHRVPRATIL